MFVEVREYAERGVHSAAVGRDIARHSMDTGYDTSGRVCVAQYMSASTSRLYFVASAGSARALVASMMHSRMSIVCGTVEACM